MSNKIRITSSYKHEGNIRSRREEEIKREPQLWSASLEYAKREGGPLLMELLDNVKWFLTKDWREYVIDTRVHMLMPDWYPAIPGFHMDDVYRVGGQPQLDHKLNQDTSHIVCVVDSGSGSLTEFANGVFELTNQKHLEGDSYYKLWNEEIKSQLARNQSAHSTDIVKSGGIYHFDCHAMHRAMPAIDRGWRVFMRISRSPRNLQRVKMSEVRTQTQVYLESLEGGW